MCLSHLIHYFSDLYGHDLIFTRRISATPPTLQSQFDVLYLDDTNTGAE
jgi:hypothetical protein